MVLGMFFEALYFGHFLSFYTMQLEPPKWILVKIGDQVFRAVLDTGATLSIEARRLLKTFKKTKTVAIRVGDGRTIHSLGGVDVTICLGDETVTQHCRVPGHRHL